MMKKRTIQLAGCLIQDEQGRILFIHRQTKDKDQWETPGGKIEPGESPKQAAVRELTEEIGVAVEITHKVGEGDFAEGDQPYRYTWFQANIVSGIPAIQELHTFTDLKYFSWDEIMAMFKRLSAGNQALTDLYQDKKFTL